MSRRGRPRIILNAGRHPLWVFVGFHALAHWLWHPGDQEFDLGSPGRLHRIELEASTIGYLALDPWPQRPYPQLARARTEGDVMRFWVRYPRPQPGGSVRWITKRTALHRFLEQMEFEW